jgi:hypothetical protein
MNDLTEYGHAVSANFPYKNRDPVQRAWLGRTVYWTNMTCDRDIIWNEDMDDEWEVDDQSIDAASALWLDGV